MSSAEIYQFEIDGVSAHLLVVRFQGTESISKQFHFEILVSCDDPTLDLAGTIGKGGTLTMTLAEGKRYIHGMVLAFENEQAGKTRSYYRVTLVPEVWKAHKKREMRIFQHMTVADIIQKVISDLGLSLSSPVMQLQGSYAQREYCVQYRESDWAFLSRLMEEEGIFYFFKHAEGKHEVVFGDKSSTNASIGEPVIFRPPAGGLAQTEHVMHFRYRHAIRPDLVSLVDYNFKKPSLSLATSAQGAVSSGIEVYDWPGHYDSPGLGSALANVQAEQWHVAGEVGSGESSCVRMTAGHIFTLSEHPTDAYDRDYLIVSVTHRGAQPDAEGSNTSTENYRNEFICIPHDTPYRPAAVTPWPSISGVQTAIVTGPAGEEIYTDEHGRVKVHFHWDRVGKLDEHSSCWIRVSQVWAGQGWGAMHIPRIGQEVVVSFIEGDPDRPLITGRVYHGTNVPPYKLPAEKTKSTIKSESSIGGGGFNELMFEDNKGNEEIFLHGQKDWTIVIENDKNQTIGHNETLQVNNNRDKTVNKDQSEKIGGNKTIEVTGAHTETIMMAEIVKVGLASSRTIGGAFVESVGAAKQSSVAGASSESVGVAKELKVGANLNESIGANATQSVGKNKEVTVGEKYQISVKKTMTTKVEENSSTDIGKNYDLNVGDTYQLVVGDGKITVKKDGTILVEGKDITVKGTGNLKVEGKKLDLKTDSTINIKAGGDIKIKGSSVGVN